MSAPIRNVIFDIGVVLLHLEFGRAHDRARAMCDPAKTLVSTSFLGYPERLPIVDEYERGELTAREFFERFKVESGFRGSFDDFVEIWRSIFAENEPMTAFAREVSARYPVYYMTNASDLHVPWIFERYPSLALHRDVACSYYLGAAKPSRDFFERGLRQFGLEGASCLLIDDRPENIAGAEACGMRALLYTTPEDTIKTARGMLDLA